MTSTQVVLAMSEKLLTCELRNGDSSKVNSYEGMVTPVEFFQDSCGFWVSQALVRDSEGIYWVRLINSHNEEIVMHKKAHVGILEIFGFEYQTFSVQTEPTENAEEEFFNSKKHVRNYGQHLTLTEMFEFRSLCTNSWPSVGRNVDH